MKKMKIPPCHRIKELSCNCLYLWKPYSWIRHKPKHLIHPIGPWLDSVECFMCVRSASQGWGSSQCVELSLYRGAPNEPEGRITRRALALSPVVTQWKSEVFVIDSFEHLCSFLLTQFSQQTKCFSLCVRGSPHFSQAAICRSSQPLSGFSARCLEDEQMLEAILRSNPRSDFMYVVDTRPKVSPLCL